MKRELIYSGPGVYVPIVGFCTVRWLRDTTGNPLMGVQIDSLVNAHRVAPVKTLENLMQEEFRRLYPAQAGKEQAQ